MKREVPDDEAGNLGVEEISGFPDGSDSKESTCSVGAAAAAKLPESCLTLCDPLDGSPPGSPSLIFSMKVKSESEVAQSCPTLRDPMDHSSPGSSIHGIFQARVLEWGVIAFSSS